MSAMQGAISAAERSMRSVFVGNIPYEATEEQLKDIFSEVGPVISFRLVYDRETGKPKGYGFCEYKDQEMALSAMRNLNGYELNGRALRVDNAASEKSKEELKNLQASLGGPPVESPYGPEVEPEKAPEEISKAVASLPPEQMFELMKQMKMCIQNNPNEARNLLLQNPQLAYALLQAQVIMRIVDPQVAMSILHRQGPPPVPVPQPEPEPVVQQMPPVSKGPSTVVMPNSIPYTSQPALPISEMGPANISPAATRASAMPSQINPALINVRGQMPMTRPSLLGERPPVMTEAPRLQGPPNQFAERAIRPQAVMQPAQVNPALVNIRGQMPMTRPSLLGDRPPVMPEAPRMQGPPNQFPERGMEPPPQRMSMEQPYVDPRAITDRDMRQPAVVDRDMRMPPNVHMPDKDMRQAVGDQDLRHMPPVTTANDGRPFDPRFRALQGGDPGRGAAPFERPRGAPFDPRTAYENRTATGKAEDPRSASQAAAARAGVPPGGSPIIPQSSPSAGASPRPPASSLAAAAAAVAPHDQEKAALIMQVLQLSDQQISMLPPEQRQSIMILKEQIARSQH